MYDTQTPGRYTCRRSGAATTATMPTKARAKGTAFATLRVVIPTKSAKYPPFSGLTYQMPRYKVSNKRRDPVQGPATSASDGGDRTVPAMLTNADGPVANPTSTNTPEPIPTVIRQPTSHSATSWPTGYSEAIISGRTP